MQAHRAAHALGLALLLALSTVAAPASAQDAVQDPKQPSVDNPHMHIWGSSDLNQCWTHFDGNDSSGSASDGYGEETSGSGTLNIEVTCRMETFVKNKILLAEGEDIHMRFKIEIDGEWRNGQGQCASDCENLNVTLMRGGVDAYTQEFPNLESGENDVHWQLPVYPDLVEWNKSQDEPAIKFTMVLKPIDGFLFFDTDALFRLYYNDEQHTDSSYNATVMFPILNDTAADEIIDEGKGNDSEDTPGFTALIGVGGLAAAALIRPSKKTEDE